MSKMKPSVLATVLFATTLSVGFCVGSYVSYRHAQTNHIYVFNGMVALNMIQDLEILNYLHKGDTERVKQNLNAAVYGTLVGWESTGLLQDLRKMESSDSLHIKDLNRALEMAKIYSETYHSPEIAASYVDIFEKMSTHNKNGQAYGAYDALQLP